MCDRHSGILGLGNCPKCGCLLDIDLMTGVRFCTNPECSYIMCICGTRMIPEPKYILDERRFKFWRCPHCFERW